MIDAGYNYERLAEKMAWPGIAPQSIRHILITHQDTDWKTSRFRRCRKRCKGIRDDIIFGAQQGFDFIAASFVRTAQDVYDIRNLLNEYDSNIRIIAKIENREGVDNIDSILSPNRVQEQDKAL